MILIWTIVHRDGRTAKVAAMSLLDALLTLGWSPAEVDRSWNEIAPGVILSREEPVIP